MTKSKGRITSGLAVVSLAAGPVAVVSIAMASPPSGVTPTVLARGKYDAFKMKPAAKGSVDFEAKAEAPLAIIVRQHDYAPESTTGWHSHPGPVFITVTKGQITFYESDDPTGNLMPFRQVRGTKTQGTDTSGAKELGNPPRT